jgi:AcrR family transcriptional regulator
VRTRRRLLPEDRRQELLDVGARLFAARPYDDVMMEEVAESAGVSRALLYRYFQSKRDLFGAIYRRAAERLLAVTELDPNVPMIEQVGAGLDAHIDYFVANRYTVLAANRALSGDPMIETIISEELAELRRRMLGAFEFDRNSREIASAALLAWLQFVRALCVEWLDSEMFSRDELREVCLGALLGAFDSVAGKPV